MIKAGEELLKLQEKNQKLSTKVYDLSSKVIALEQDKLELQEKLQYIEQILNDQITNLDGEDLCLNTLEYKLWDLFNKT